ncbi:hypothetical protein ACQKJG_18635 [Priestia megaterium]|uniref:hypothetical protein n=1 Tax=Priestia megaterium TaxID=1404 RepID=UPI003D053E82
MIPIRNKNTDIASEVAQGRRFQEKVKRLSQQAAEKSVNQNIDLSKVLADISKKESFNRVQIQRLVEESNTIAYNLRYDKKRSSNDRRISFQLASLADVVEEMGSDAPPEMNNPNLSSGKAGEGSMDKAASVEPSYFHNLNADVDGMRQRQMEKRAAYEKQENEKELNRLKRESESCIFKIANSLVMTEKQYKTGNEVFNTLLNDVSLTDDAVEGITKKASFIGQELVKRRRARPDFVVTLTEEHSTKVADHVLGEYSLLKQADDSTKVKEIKIQPTSQVNDYQQLIALARQLERQQEAMVQKTAPADSEVKVNGTRQ